MSDTPRTEEQERNREAKRITRLLLKSQKSVLRAARNREPLDGSDAQALAVALDQAERELAAERCLVTHNAPVQRREASDATGS